MKRKTPFLDGANASAEARPEYEVRYFDPATDLKAVLSIERASGMEEIYAVADLERIHEMTDAAILVAERRLWPSGMKEVVGYLAIQEHPHKQTVFLLVSIAVRQDIRRTGAGSALLRWAKERGRPRLSCMMRESYLGAQLFLKAQGFKCRKVQPDFFDCPPEPGYFFTWSAPRSEVDERDYQQ